MQKILKLQIAPSRVSLLMSLALFGLKIKYSVENTRVEQRTDYEKLILEILTDGSIHPEDALKGAANILIKHFMLFSDDRIMLETQTKEVSSEVDEEILHTFPTQFN